MLMPIPAGITIIRAPETAELLEVANEAAARGLQLITNGREMLLSSMILPGWHRLGVSIKEAA